MNPGNGLRIVIAEDAAIMRDGLTQTLARRGHDVVAAVANAEELIYAVTSHQPDVAVIDVRMPPTHTDEGLRAAMAIRRDYPGVRHAGLLPVHRGAGGGRATGKLPRRRRLPAEGPRRRRE